MSAPVLPICCSRCSEYDWTRAPKLAAVLVLALRYQAGLTARVVADLRGLSIANASNQITRLALAGLVRVARYDNVPGGGREAVYVATDAARDELPHARKAAA